MTTPSDPHATPPRGAGSAPAAAARPARGDRPEPGARSGELAGLVGRLRQDPFLRFAAVVIVVSVLGFALVVATAAVVWEQGHPLHPDTEKRVAAGLSALALVAAGGAAVSAGVLARAGWQLLPVGGLLLFMAVDEWATLHERLEASTGTDWQLLYLPVFAVAGLSFLLAAHRHRSHRAFLAPWLAGAVCWVVSQGLELAQWDADDRRQGYRAMMVPEEVLEVTGSLLFLFAALVLHRRRAAPPTGVLSAR